MSTLIELLGFALLIIAAYHFGLVYGLIAAGIFLLFIGYSMEDEMASVLLHRIAASLKTRLPHRKSGTP